MFSVSIFIYLVGDFCVDNKGIYYLSLFFTVPYNKYWVVSKK